MLLNVWDLFLYAFCHIRFMRMLDEENKGQGKKKSENMKYQISHYFLFFIFFSLANVHVIFLSDTHTHPKNHRRLILSTIYNEEKLQERNMFKHEN